MADYQAVTEHYRTLPDFEVEHIAWFEAHELEKDVLPILRAEVARRRLDRALLEAIDIHDRGFPPEDFQSLVNWLRQSPCPHCGGTERRLNGCRVESVNGLLFFSRTSSENLVGCPPCLTTRLRSANSTSGCSGCLSGGLFGAFSAIGAISRNELALLEIELEEPTAALLDHVRHHIAPLGVKWRAQTGRSARR